MFLWQDLHNAMKVSFSETCSRVVSTKVSLFPSQNFPLLQQKDFPKWSLYLVGSTISGFGSDLSDIDMCLVSKGSYHLDLCVDPRMEAMVTLNDLKNYLMNSMSEFAGFNDETFIKHSSFSFSHTHFSLLSIINVKVPILRFRDPPNKIEINLTYNNCIGVRNTHLLFSYTQRKLQLIVSH